MEKEKALATILVKHIASNEIVEEFYIDMEEQDVMEFADVIYEAFDREDYILSLVMPVPEYEGSFV